MYGYWAICHHFVKIVTNAILATVAAWILLNFRLEIGGMTKIADGTEWIKRCKRWKQLKWHLMKQKRFYKNGTNTMCRGLTLWWTNMNNDFNGINPTTIIKDSRYSRYLIQNEFVLEMATYENIFLQFREIHNMLDDLGQIERHSQRLRRHTQPQQSCGV